MWQETEQSASASIDDSPGQSFLVLIYSQRNTHASKPVSAGRVVVVVVVCVAFWRLGLIHSFWLYKHVASNENTHRLMWYQNECRSCSLKPANAHTIGNGKSLPLLRVLHKHTALMWSITRAKTTEIPKMNGVFVERAKKIDDIYVQAHIFRNYVKYAGCVSYNCVS